MGFFNKPFKATKAFFKDPVKVVANDLRKMDLLPPKNPTCPQMCDHNLKMHDKTNGGMNGLESVLPQAAIGHYVHGQCLKGCKK